MTASLICDAFCIEIFLTNNVSFSGKKWDLLMSECSKQDGMPFMFRAAATLIWKE